MLSHSHGMCGIFASLVILLAGDVSATTIVSGQVTNFNGVTLGAGNNSFPSEDFFVGLNTGATGSIEVNGGSSLTAGGLTLGSGGSGAGTVTATGNGSRIDLVQPKGNPLQIAHDGQGTLNVLDGAMVDATAGPCPSFGCNVFVGNFAGSTGTINIHGLGSHLKARNDFVLGGVGVATQAGDGFDFGTPGATTNATVNVSGGGLLQTETGTLGRAPSFSAAIGTETSNATVNVTGVGSKWLIQHDSAFINMAKAGNAIAEINVLDGGIIEIDSTSGGAFSGIHMAGEPGSTGGSATINVEGANSQLEVKTTDGAGLLNVGRNGGSAAVNVMNGGSIDGFTFVTVGRSGSTGTLLIDGQDSLFRMPGSGGPDSGGSENVGAFLNIGRHDGTAASGTAIISNGGRLELDSNGADTSNGDVGVIVGRGTGANGTLIITGDDGNGGSSTLSVTSDRTPFITIGATGQGTLNVTNGGKLNMASTSTIEASTLFATGVGFGASYFGSGGNGTGLVSGFGSEITTTGTNGAIFVGEGSGSAGTLTVSNGGRLSTASIFVGNPDTTGTLNLDNGTIELSGDAYGFGTFLTIGRNGFGTVNAGNGTQINLDGSIGGATIGIASSQSNPGGSGTFNLFGGSAIAFANDLNAEIIVGGTDSATGTLIISGGSTISGLGTGGRIVLSNDANGTGLMTVNGGSMVDAGGFLGIGHNGSSETGTAVLTANDTSVVQATTIQIGKGGLLGGDGVVNGNVVNGGTINPGNSTGRLRINGDYTNAGGTIVLEVESDGSGGFNTDAIVFDTGATIDMVNAEICFAFLSDTDPAEFLNSGSFHIDTFLKTNASGLNNPSQDQAISLTFDLGTLLSSANYVAKSDSFQITSFAFSSTDGATALSANAIPEPSTVGLLLTGLLSIFGVRRLSKKLRKFLAPRRTILRHSAVLLLLATCEPTTAAPLVVFNEDFGSGALPPEISGAGNVVDAQGFKGVGGFSDNFLQNVSQGNPALSTTLTLFGLPVHDSITLDFLLAIIDSWDGNAPSGNGGVDFFNVAIDGVVIYSETFTNLASLNPVFSQSATISNQTIAPLSSLGFYVFSDSGYDMGELDTFKNISHSASTLTIQWFASGAGWQGAGDENWALDNITVSVNTLSNTENVPEPIPVWMLLGALVILLAFHRRHIRQLR